DQASGLLQPIAAQKVARRREGFDTISGGAQDHRERVAYRLVIVDEIHGTARPGLHVSLPGSTKWNAVPPSVPASCQIRPPCISTIDRQMLRPRPKPFARVVKNGE